MYELWYGPRENRRHVKRETIQEIEQEQEILKEQGFDENIEVIQR